MPWRAALLLVSLAVNALAGAYLLGPRFRAELPEAQASAPLEPERPLVGATYDLGDGETLTIIHVPSEMGIARECVLYRTRDGGQIAC